MTDVPTPPETASRSWASVSHLAGLAILSGMPFSNVLGPLILYLIKKDEDSFVAVAARESLNFQIFVSICGVVLFAGYIASFVSAFFSVFEPSKAHPPILAFAILPFFLILGIFDVASVAIAAIRSYNGEAYRYPITLRFVR
jgi:uncharacterized protein